MLLRRLILAFTFFAVQSVSAQNFKSATSKPYTGPECGVSGYEQPRRQECGVELHRFDTGEPCGAKLYREEASLLCPGSDAGGRVVKQDVSFSNSRNFTIYWPSNQPTVQGGEALPNGSFEIYSWGQVQRDAVTFVRETPYWSCSIRQSGYSSGSSQAYYGTMVCRSKPYAPRCRLRDFGVEEWNSCRNSAFGDELYRACDDLSKPIYKSCQVLLTPSEVSFFVDTVEANIDYNAETYATNLAIYLNRRQDKATSSCLIDRYNTRLFKPVIDELITQFETTFREIYIPGEYADECNNENFVPGPLVYQGLSCKDLTSEQVRSGITGAGEDRALKRFYQDCFAQKGYEQPYKWFEFHLGEINRLLSDTIALGNETARQRLDSIKTKLLDAEVLK